MIEIENVYKSFGALQVLKGINLTVPKGEVLTVIGGSGSGKSTLLTCINGLEKIDSGRHRGGRHRCACQDRPT
jgi:ABC-type polar amino acid transport system ATPase subunit